MWQRSKGTRTQHMIRVLLWGPASLAVLLARSTQGLEQEVLELAHLPSELINLTGRFFLSQISEDCSIRFHDVFRPHT